MKVLSKMNMPASKRENLDVFICDGSSPQYHGSFAQRWTCLLGLPSYFKLCNDEDFESNQESLVKRNFPWTHPSAGAVKSGFLLTEEEKRFVIARQMGYLDSWNVWMRLGLRATCFTTACLAAHFTSYRLGLLRGEVQRGVATAGGRPARLVGVIYAVCCLMGLGVYTTLSDSYTRQLDAYADSYAATISPRFCLAGLSYYNKVLNSNIALREILPNGEKAFTKYGNEPNGILRMKAVTLVSRRNYMKDMCDKSKPGDTPDNKTE